jgi:serine/threonine-protein kinase
VIALEPEADEPEATPTPRPTPARSTARATPRSEPKSSAAAAKSAPAETTKSDTPPTKSGASTAKLNLNAIPRATVLLDGRPIGSTPKLGVEVSAGSHTVIFISGELRKSTAVTVEAGETKTVALRLSE